MIENSRMSIPNIKLKLGGNLTFKLQTIKIKIFQPVGSFSVMHVNTVPLQLYKQIIALIKKLQQIRSHGTRHTILFTSLHSKPLHRQENKHNC